MGPYDEDLGRNLDSNDVQNDVQNGRLTESSISPGTYYDGSGTSYDSEYNPVE